MMNKQTNIEPVSLHMAMAMAFSEIEAATKSANNPHFKTKYADLGAVIEAIKPALIKHSLFFVQLTHEAANGVCVETVIHHSNGDSMSGGKLFVPANKNDAQGFGSALTYARRYSLMTAFGVAPEDDDGNAAAKSAPPRITADEPPVKPAEKLEGPYSSPSKLKAAIKAFAETLRTTEDDLAGFNAWMATDEVIELERAALRYLPGWWETGEGMPPEFEPIQSRIQRKSKELEERDSIANSPAANNLRAG